MNIRINLSFLVLYCYGVSALVLIDDIKTIPAIMLGLVMIGFILSDILNEVKVEDAN